ncbi:MAG TPA: TlpA disulfide reductase family protein [Kofleriaceae bacterium]|jgi:thiol-disulfide isomerase/thioredoxin|nr:TlpA disulfide reductase family protein [Kofleriaceae bacterium]
MTNGAFSRVLATFLLCALGACTESAPAAAPPSAQTAKKPAQDPGTPPPAPGAPSPGSAAPPQAAGIQAAGTPPPAPGTPSEEPGVWYRAELIFDGVGDLPFFLHLPPVGQPGKAYAVNGEEKAPLEAVWHDNDVKVTGPWAYTLVIAAHRNAETGTLEGTWTRDTPLWGAVVRKFVARPIKEPDPRIRFPGNSDPKPLNVAGTWKFQFAEHKDGKGAFEQGPDGVIHGYVRPGMLGDLRFLSGNVRGKKLSLSQFNGNSANLVFAKVSPDGKTMSGLISMQNVWNEKFTAKKVDDYQFVNKVRMKKGKQTLTLQGLNKYKGKPTLALIFATWCPSCNDAHPFFTRLYAKYHPQGLEVLGVAFDLSEDEKSNLAEIDKFRAKHKIPWELLQEPCTPDTWAKTMPPEVEGWDGFPVVALIRPDGTVQTVFGGWFGPATGTEGEKLRTWFEGELQKLVESAKQ